MIIPLVNLLDPIENAAGLQKAALYLPTVVLSPAAFPALDIASSWVPLAQSEDPLSTSIALLDAGAQKLIVPATILLSHAAAFAGIPIERLSAEVEAGQEIEQLLPLVSAFVVRGHDNAWLALLAETCKRNMLPSGGTRKVVIDVQSETLSVSRIGQLNKSGIDVLVSLKQLTLSADEKSGKINLGHALAASLVSDRADGLFPTVVVDERDVALGLVYSSKESIAESLRTGTGVYQSRSRGLWYKGATSGATQALVRIMFDCDGDTLKFIVSQHGTGFCHLNMRSCFGAARGLTGLERTLLTRKDSAPTGSYTARLFNDSELLRSKIMEEAEELCDADTKEKVAWEAADLIYFVLTKCVAEGVTLDDVERNLDMKAKKISRRPGNAKPKREMSIATSLNWSSASSNDESKSPSVPAPKTFLGEVKMKTFFVDKITTDQRAKLLLRPIINTIDIKARVQPIIDEVRKRGDAAVLEFTAKFDGVNLSSSVIHAPFPSAMYAIDDATRAAIDQAYDNIFAFHDAQMDHTTLVVETMPGVICQRFARPIEKVGLYVPGGTAILPSTTLMLGIPAKVAGCKEIVIATPPRKDGTISPEVMYVAQKVGATTVLAAGGAQAVAAMAYGTKTVPKVDKICGPGNQYVTAAKMIAQNDHSSLTSIDMPAGPSEVLVVADANSNPAYVASDLLSQAEHGTDSQVVLVAVNLTEQHLGAIEQQIKEQTERLPRATIVRKVISQSFTLRVKTVAEAMEFVNDYAPEHLILQVENAEFLVAKVKNAGSVFVGPYSPESCGDYASGTNHTLPTYGYAKMYSGVNTLTFLKHITSQHLTADGLYRLGNTVMQLAEVEGLEAHRNAVDVRLKDLRKRF